MNIRDIEQVDILSTRLPSVSPACDSKRSVFLTECILLINIENRPEVYPPNGFQISFSDSILPCLLFPVHIFSIRFPGTPTTQMLQVRESEKIKKQICTIMRQYRTAYTRS